jgi:rhodanese-related sulfurtransferase
MALANSVERAPSPLSELAAKAADRKPPQLAYAGEVTPEEAYYFLQSHEGLLVDVRTLPEWQFTGLPDISTALGRLVTASWKVYPSFTLNPVFADTLAADETIRKDTPLFFLCRSGGRSLDAAIAMTALGYEHCFNIIGGFEGEPDASGHRGGAQGWKASKLPWKQG